MGGLESTARATAPGRLTGRWHLGTSSERDPATGQVPWAWLLWTEFATRNRTGGPEVTTKIELEFGS